MKNEMTRRQFGQVLSSTMGATVLRAGALPARPPAPHRPNILFICSDQHNGRMLMGGPGEAVQAQTPNLKRLAAKGVWFRNACTVAPVCVPGRAAMMTGRFASDVGSYCNSTPFDGRVPTWANYLRDTGYYCWATGKLDMTPHKDFGFKEVNTEHGHFSQPDITSLFRRPICFRVDERPMVDGGPGEGGRRHDEQVIEAGLNFLRTEAGQVGKPWAMYLGMIRPHPPYLAQQKFLDLYPPAEMTLPNIPPGLLENEHLFFQAMRNYKLESTPIPEERVRRARSAYYACISEADDNIGRILDHIDATDGLNNTLVIYTADHGEMLGTHGLWQKDALLEGGVRVPMILAGAGLPQGKIVDTPVSHVDLIATMLAAAGIETPEGLRGRSLLPMMREGRTDFPKFVYAESNGSGTSTGSFMIRSGEWKYIYFTWYNDHLLFNLQDDPEELINLATKPEFAEVAQELHGLLTSLVDPETITEQAFEQQARVLAKLLQESPPERFFQGLNKRLGKGQAVALMKKLRPNWKPSSA